MRWEWIPQVLKDAGLPVVTYEGYETRGRDDGAEQPGVVWHHTVSGTNWTDANVDKLLATKGNTTTPPPLCNIGVDRAGTMRIICTGVANHAGAGGWRGRNGNRTMIGIEMYNLGTAAEPFPATQLDAVRRATAALLVHTNASADLLCGHKEWSPGRKSDPHSLNMSWERSYVTSIMPPFTIPLPVPPTAYPDINGNWAEDAIRQIIGKGIMVGDGKLWFPDRALTRAEFAWLMVHRGKQILELVAEQA